MSANWKDIVSPGNDWVIGQSSRAYGAPATEILKVRGSDGKATLKGNQLLAGQPLVMAVALGHNGAGDVTLTGVKAGDKVASVANLTTPGDATSSFESTISADGKIHQSSATDLSAKELLFTVVKQSQ